MSEAKIKDVGLGFTLSSGQSFFYLRGTNPYSRNQGFYSLGLHIEEEGIAVATQSYYGATPQRNAKQSLYLETNIGWRRLWFQDKLAGGFFPHTTVELGGVGFFDRGGTLENYLQDVSLTWAPSLAAGFGGTVATKNSIVRFEMGYLSTIKAGAKADFPHYDGFYLRVSMSNWERPR
ncbi:hypothetical protein ACFL6E_04490 [Candidatus Neomarinimicrobiota bacterium]